MPPTPGDLFDLPPERGIECRIAGAQPPPGWPPRPQEPSPALEEARPRAARRLALVLAALVVVALASALSAWVLCAR